LTLTASVIMLLAGLAVAAGSALLKRRQRTAAAAVTWDCGYSLPSPKMQYTASSFVAPIVAHFQLPLGAKEKFQGGPDFFPAREWRFHSKLDDWFLDGVFRPLVKRLDRGFALLRWFQSGKTGQYVSYIALAAFCLIIWKFFL
jgi:hypothetical protein